MTTATTGTNEVVSTEEAVGIYRHSDIVHRFLIDRDVDGGDSRDEIRSRQCYVESESESSYESSVLSHSNVMGIKVPELGDAIKHLNRTSLRRLTTKGKTFEPYPICKTPVSEFGKFSLGLMLFFVFLKRTAFLLLFCTLLSISAFYSNHLGGYINVGDDSSGVAVLSLGNQKGVSRIYVNSVVDEGNPELYDDLIELIGEQRNHKILVMAPIIAISLLTLFFVRYSRTESRQIRKDVKRSRVSVASFSVEVLDIPPDIREPDLRQHFRSYGEIVEVYIARQYSDVMALFKEEAAMRIKRARKLNRQHALGEMEKSSCWLNSSIRRLDRKIEGLNKQIRKEFPSLKKQEDLPALRAYITFRTLKAKRKCIKAYHKFNKFRLCGKRRQKAKLRLGEVYRIRVHDPQEPSEILWENLEVTKWQRFGRKLVALVLVLIMLMISTVLIYLLKAYDDTLVDEAVCLDIDNSIPTSREAARDLLSIDPNAVKCWCRSIGWSKVLSDTDLINNICKAYVLERTRKYLLQLGAALGVTVVNHFLREVLHKLSAFQRFHTLSSEQRSALVTVLIAQYLNSAVIPVVVYADLKGSVFFRSIIQYVPFLEPLLIDGGVNDFTREWYTKVSPAIVAFMAINVFVPHLLQLIWAPILYCRRKYRWKKRVTQRDLNTLYQGRNFKLSHVYSQSLNTIFVAFTFGPGLPIVYVLATAALTLQFFCNKTFLLRIARRPPHYNESLHTRVITLFPIALLLNLGMALLMLGNSDVWPLEKNVHQVHSNGAARIDRNSAIDMVTSFTGYPLSGALFCVIVYILTRGVVDNYVKLCKKDKKILPKNVKDFYEELDNIEHNGLKTYNLRSNPRYRDIILAMDEYSADLKNPHRAATMVFVSKKDQRSVKANFEASSLLSVEDV